RLPGSLLRLRRPVGPRKCPRLRGWPPTKTAAVVLTDLDGWVLIVGGGHNRGLPSTAHPPAHHRQGDNNEHHTRPDAGGNGLGDEIGQIAIGCGETLAEMPFNQRTNERAQQDRYEVEVVADQEKTDRPQCC